MPIVIGSSLFPPPPEEDPSPPPQAASARPSTVTALPALSPLPNRLTAVPVYFRCLAIEAPVGSNCRNRLRREVAILCGRSHTCQGTPPPVSVVMHIGARARSPANGCGAIRPRGRQAFGDRPGRQRAGVRTSWTAHVLPSGSSKKRNEA